MKLPSKINIKHKEQDASDVSIWEIEYLYNNNQTKSMGNFLRYININ
jgi:hypothetical protein